MNTRMQTTAVFQAASGLMAARGGLVHLQTRPTKARRRSDDDEDFLFASDPFVGDKNRLLCAKAYRRLSGKTQVTSFPHNPYIRDRMSHTGEVVAVSTVIADVLGLNLNLTETIAIGHDIGHTPLGHSGEKFLAERSGRKFTHEVMGVIIAQHVERRGRGLNLTHQVLDGMLRHSGTLTSECIEKMTPEAVVVRLADKVAYLTADYNDFERAGMPISSKLRSVMESFGSNQRKRVATLVSAICEESCSAGKVCFMTTDAAFRFAELRKLMYEVYPRITAQDPRRVLEPIYDFIERSGVADPLLVLGLMTDRDVERLAQQHMLDIGHLKETGAGEALPFENLRQMRIDCDPDLDW